MRTVKMAGAIVCFRDDNIIHIHYDGSSLTLKDAKALIKSLREESPWDICPIYISAEPFSEHDKDAEKYLAGEEVMKFCSAVGILTNNLAQKIAINFFINFQKPSKPTRFFTSEENAIKWLKNFKTIKNKKPF